MSATIACSRCRGEGHISHYAGIAGGVCFGCNGAGRIPAPDPKAVRRAEQRRKAADTKRQRALQERETEAETRYGEDFRLARAVSKLDHPYAVRAGSVFCDMRDGKPDWVIEMHLTETLPKVIKDLGLTGLSLAQIEAQVPARYRSA